VTLTAPTLPAREWRRAFDGDVREVAASLAWLDDILRPLDLPEDQSYALRLCAEELLANVVLHNRDRTPLHVRITLEAKPDRLALTIEDNGAFFDIVNAPTKRVDQPIDRVQPGGLGVVL
jgi:serine/threonine-protein kinase RsbW